MSPGSMVNEDLDSTSIYLHPSQADTINAALEALDSQKAPGLNGMDRRGIEPRASSMPRKRSTADLSAQLFYSGMGNNL